jgi:hypothetical protein
MSSSLDMATQPEPSQIGDEAPLGLAREAGVPFQAGGSSDSGVDPIADWLSLMEVVQMLCPVWPVREHGMQGNCWRL